MKLLLGTLKCKSIGIFGICGMYVNELIASPVRMVVSMILRIVLNCNLLPLNSIGVFALCNSMFGLSTLSLWLFGEKPAGLRGLSNSWGC